MFFEINIPFRKRRTQCSTWNKAGQITCFIALFVVGIILTGCTSKKTDELVVGMDLSYPPFEMIDPQGKPAGVSVDLAKALAAYLGQELKIENIPFVGLIPSLQNGRLDCVISSMTETPERKQVLDFSDPYLATGLAALVPQNSSIQSGKDIDQPGTTVVVRRGTTGEVWVRSHIHQARILVVDKENAAVLEVAQGKADAFVYDQMSIWKNAKLNPKTTKGLLASLQQEYWAVGIQKGNESLRVKINEFLKKFRAEGGFDKLSDKYLKDQKEDFKTQGIPFYFEALPASVTSLDTDNASQ